MNFDLDIDAQNSLEELMSFYNDIEDTGKFQYMDYRENDLIYFNLDYDNNLPVSTVESPSSKQNELISHTTDTALTNVAHQNGINYNACDAQFEQNLSIRRRRSPKRKIDLSDDASELKYRYYSIFTNSKKFPKEYVLQIHKEYFMPQLGYSKLKRKQMRRIDSYFMDYAEKKDEILKFLEKNKVKLLHGPLKNIKNQKSF